MKDSVSVVLLLILGWAAQAKAQDAPLPQAPDRARPASNYQFITSKQRLSWFLDSTVGPETLTVGLFSAAIGTARDAPYEYGPHWEGFAKRYGMRLTGVSTGNAIEASLGSLWGEDPRYFRDGADPLKLRIRHVLVTTFTAHNREGQVKPAFARYIATPGNNFLSNSWRVDSEATNRAAALRTVWGFVGLMSKNAFTEFWPDLKQKAFVKFR